jgi:hypothetical protein
MWHAIQEAKSGEMPLTVLYAIARKNVRACLMLGGNERDVNGPIAAIRFYWLARFCWRQMVKRGAVHEYRQL